MTSAVQSAGRTLLDTLPPKGHVRDTVCMFERHGDGWQPMNAAALRDEVTLLALGL